MFSPDGDCLYLVWHFGPNDRTGIRYRKCWKAYFCRPVYLFKCPMSKYAYFLYHFDAINKFINILDVYSTMGHFKGRRVPTTACAVREPHPIVMKSSKFHSLLTYCSKTPLNWVYCCVGT